MGYKILHFSDLHLDASFAGQGFPVDYGKERRLDLRAALMRIISKARELKVNAITIGGDLFVQEYLLPETTDFILQQLASLDPIRVIIAPGIKDLFTNGSPYANLNWPKNVEIFYQSKLKPIELAPDIHLWGACNPPVRGQNLLDGFKPKEGINILLLYAQRNKKNSEIHNINIEELQRSGFKLALLGSEHLAEFSADKYPYVIFPGSPEPLSPNEQGGKHQVIFIDVQQEDIRIQPLSLQQWNYISLDVDVTPFVSSPELANHIESILEIETNKSQNSALTVRMRGIPHFDLSLSGLSQLLQTSANFRLEYEFGLNFDLEQLAREQTVRGLLVKGFLSRIRAATAENDKQIQLTALNMALQALDGQQVNLYETKKN